MQTNSSGELGIVGLGKMGLGIARRLMQSGWSVTGFDIDSQARSRASDSGATVIDRLDALPGRLKSPRVLWLMLPAGDVTEEAFQALLPQLSAGDVLIEGGNSLYRDTIRRAEQADSLGIHLLDVGTSGGIHGERDGFCLMIGGTPEIATAYSSLFDALAADGRDGWAHVGPNGAGHFVKMIHNGIEYGAMQAYAEGLTILREKKEFDLDLAQITEVWRHGSVVRSWLLDLVADMLRDDASLLDVAPHVADSGEGRWTVGEAIDLDIPAPVLTLALLQRLRSRVSDSYTDRLLAAMRRAFGGHATRKPGDDRP